VSVNEHESESDDDEDEDEYLIADEISIENRSNYSLSRRGALRDLRVSLQEHDNHAGVPRMLSIEENIRHDRHRRRHRHNEEERRPDRHNEDVQIPHRQNEEERRPDHHNEEERHNEEEKRPEAD